MDRHTALLEHNPAGLIGSESAFCAKELDKNSWLPPCYGLAHLPLLNEVPIGETRAESRNSYVAKQRILPTAPFHLHNKSFLRAVPAADTQADKRNDTKNKEYPFRHDVQSHRRQPGGACEALWRANTTSVASTALCGREAAVSAYRPGSCK